MGGFLSEEAFCVDTDEFDGENLIYHTIFFRGRLSPLFYLFSRLCDD